MRVLTAARLMVLLATGLAGCTAGTAEFALYDAAYDAQHAESTRVLDRLGDAETTLRARLSEAEDGIAPFDPDRAPQILGLGDVDPPLTASLRHSLDALKSYNDALSGLATGAAAEALALRLQTASTALSEAAQSVLGVAGVGVAGVGAPGAGLQASLAAALPALQQIATITDRARFRRDLVAAYPAMRDLLEALRGSTPAMFDVMKRSHVVPGLLEDDVEGVPITDLPKVEADRKLLAGWVLLLDATLDAMDAAVAAADSRDAVDMTALVAGAAEVKALADTIGALRSAN
ncbi:MAG: hypothetical protein AAFR46_11820 [Pseudomonadota bacterium]